MLDRQLVDCSKWQYTWTERTDDYIQLLHHIFHPQISMHFINQIDFITLIFQMGKLRLTGVRKSSRLGKEPKSPELQSRVLSIKSSNFAEISCCILLTGNCCSALNLQGMEISVYCSRACKTSINDQVMFYSSLGLEISGRFRISLGSCPGSRKVKKFSTIVLKNAEKCVMQVQKCYGFCRMGKTVSTTLMGTKILLECFQFTNKPKQLSV